MYQIKNSILHKDGKKVFVLGQSYYPSFHPCKFPVPPEGDRIGEMKKDLAGMSEAGFNHVRFAALGDVTLNEDGSLSVNTPFIDAMTEEAAKNDLSVSIREQGYTVNLRNFEDVLMIDWNGTPQGTYWSDFIRTTMCHEGILEDNKVFAKALAEHYEKYDNVVGYQIYNEPHYPGDQVFDYHETFIAAYRKWLVKKGHMTAEEAADYQPPRGRKEQSEHMWALWRLFAQEALTNFLNHASDSSKLGSSRPTFTCLTLDQTSATAVYRHVDFFANAKAMDLVGYTSYQRPQGAEYPALCLPSDIAQCAALLEGKEAWCIELDSRTYIPHSVYNRETYATLGTGCKGIVYYQWRGDCPVEGVPHPNSCGILNYDGTKTNNFDNAVNVNRYITGLNDLLVNANRAHEGFGILHSDYAIFLCDARENGDKQARNTDLHNSYLMEYTQTYRELREAGYTVAITDAEHLDANPLGIRVLFVPHLNMLSPEEQEAVERFRLAGGEVYQCINARATTLSVGYWKYDTVVKSYEETRFNMSHTVYDVADATGIYPTAEPLTRQVGVQSLKGDGYHLIVLTNTAVAEKTISPKIRLNIPFTSAECIAMDGKKEVLVNGNEITVKDITDGGILVIK